VASRQLFETGLQHGLMRGDQREIDNLSYFDVVQFDRRLHDRQLVPAYLIQFHDGMPHDANA